jgi:hypothetical protein
MRLSDDKARRLSQLVWRDRARRWLPLIGAAIALFVMLAYVTDMAVNRVDRAVDVKVRSGTVLNLERKAAGRRTTVVRVQLEDGRDIDALSGLRLLPKAGEHVLINEVRHASGRLTYEVARLVD